MGTKSPTKLKLRSNTFKCDLCGRKYSTSSALNFHQQCVHSKAMKTLKTDIGAVPKPKKVLVKLKQPLKSKKTVTAKKKSISQTKHKTMKKPQKMVIQPVKIVQDMDEVDSVECDLSEPEFRRTNFECPKCRRMYSVYFQAFKHIQKNHCINSKGQDVKPNSTELIKPVPVDICTLCRRRLTSGKHVCSATKELEDIKFASKYTCTGCDGTFISMKTYDLHVSSLHSEGVESMFFPTVKEFYDWKMDMESQTKIKYTVLGKYNSKQYYRCSHMPFFKHPNGGTALFCPSTIVIHQYPKGIQCHFYRKHYGHQCFNYNSTEYCKKYDISKLMREVGEAEALEMKRQDTEAYSEVKSLIDSVMRDAARAKASTLKLLLAKALEMAAILDSSGDSLKYHPVEEEKDESKNEIINDKEISEVLEKVNDVKSLKVQRVPPAKRVAEIEKVDAKRKRETSFDNGSLKIMESFSVADRPDIEKVLEEASDDDNEETPKVIIEKSKNASGKESKQNKDNLPRPKVQKVSFMSPPSFNDTYKDFVDKNFTTPMDKKKTVVKTKIGQFKPNSPKSNKNKAKVNNILPKDLSKVKITDYEVKERENDCNILILKI